MVWVHNSCDSSRAHEHVPRSQFESMHVYYREGEGKLMEKASTYAKSYAFHEHVGLDAPIEPPSTHVPQPLF